MIELEIRDTSKGNRYRIVQDVGRHVQLECVLFCGKEDLGDQIFCDEDGEKIWIAKYHSDTMKKIDV